MDRAVCIPALGKSGDAKRRVMGWPCVKKKEKRSRWGMGIQDSPDRIVTGTLSGRAPGPFPTNFGSLDSHRNCM